MNQIDAIAARVSRLPMIPVLRPQLPTADRIFPYLKRIDEERTYSNFGPLTREFQCRLQSELRGAAATIICMNSGTSALIAAVLATASANTAKPIAILPDLTFAATAAAIERCGFAIHLTDVDVRSRQLDPTALRRHPLLAAVGLVVPVATFGRAVAQAPWVQFSRESGIPVVIDGAASFASIVRAPDCFVGDIPTVLSFHATKSFGVGEGGCVMWNAQQAEQRLTQACNFGFFEDRISVAPSLNAKMSEYHAAVGLAELDGWSNKAKAFQRANDAYRSHGAELGLIQYLLLFPETDYIYPMFVCPNRDECGYLARVLDEARISTRLWYGGGLQSHPAFANYSSDDLRTSKQLATRLLGLPMAVDLETRDIRRIMEVIAKALQSRSWSIE